MPNTGVNLPSSLPIYSSTFAELLKDIWKGLSEEVYFHLHLKINMNWFRHSCSFYKTAPYWFSTIFLCLLPFSQTLLLQRPCLKINMTSGNEKEEEATGRLFKKKRKTLNFSHSTTLVLSQVAAVTIPTFSHLDRSFHWAWADSQEDRYTDSFQRYFYIHAGKCLCFHIHQYLCRKKAECITMQNKGRNCDRTNYTQVVDIQ